MFHEQPLDHQAADFIRISDAGEARAGIGLGDRAGLLRLCRACDSGPSGKVARTGFGVLFQQDR